MKKNEEITASATDLATQPFFYEIRVRGRLSEEQWMGWFDNKRLHEPSNNIPLAGCKKLHRCALAADWCT